MLHFLVALLGFFSPLSLWAHQGVNEINAWVSEAQEQVAAYLEEAEQFKESAEGEVSKMIKEKGVQNSCCQQMQTVYQDKRETRTKDPSLILIFVSLSMPKESLKNLYKEAEQQGLSLLIRGLKNNSFKETAHVLKELEIAVQIDPQLFEAHQIEVVPTFVKVDNKESLHIQGNISLSYARKKFEGAL